MISPSVAAHADADTCADVRRTRDATRTRAAILEAARAAFAEDGYPATVRDIARRAGVDAALVVRYFGSKEGLFTAASRLSLDLGWVADIAVDRLGPELVRHFLSRWDSGAGTDPFIGLLRAATTNDTAARLLRDVIAEQCHAPLVSRLPGPDAELRVGLVGSFLLGLGLSRYVLRQDALADVSPDIVAAAVAPVLQHYLTGDLNPVACLD